MSDEALYYLEFAMTFVHTTEKDVQSYNAAAAYAAIAQAEALIRIAECLEKIVDDMAQTKRTLEEWEGEL